MIWVAVILLVLIFIQVCALSFNIAEVRRALIAASDLNLAAHARLLEQMKDIEHHLSQMPKVREPWEP